MRWLTLALFGSSLFTLTGCPVTDDYYIDGDSSGEGGSVGAGAGGVVASSGTDTRGGRWQRTDGGATTYGAGGTSDGGVAAQVATGGTTCMMATERCNGRDDDCDGVADDMACSPIMGCTGFVLPSAPNHGYMLCTSPVNADRAATLCAGQEMRLAWLESDAENRAVTAEIAKISNSTELLFGASDAAIEGDWVWPGPGGFLFWRGAEWGMPVNGAFNAWAPQTPNDGYMGEDCGVLLVTTTTWGDRSCAANWAFLCEEPD